MGRSWTGMACSKYSNVYEFGGIIDWTGDIEGGEQEQSVDDNWQNTEALPETDETGNNNGVENGGDDMKEAAKLLYQGHASMPHICVMDYPTIEYKGGKLIRTKTLGAGDDCCDFHVVKKD
ncbi:MAG: L-2-amino-thiazoline-4-carboxylic acid hydrolase [Clostridiales bacterium]|nr:L-2-amino-thiazoline-4-carboxylic acid hydrolase [Clostridiales bacterium]